VELLLAAILIFLCGPRRARKAAAAVGGLAIIAAVLLFFWMAPRQTAERLATMADATHSPEVALADRLAPARDSLRIFRDHPWLGAGLGSFETVFPRYQSFPSDFTWDHAHNDYAEALAETGIVGGALILFSLGLFFRLAFKEVLSRQFSVGSPAFRTSDFGPRTSDSLSPAPSPESRVPSPQPHALRPVPRVPNPMSLMQLGAAVGGCGLLVHSFVDFNLHIPANAAWFAVCAAIATVNPCALRTQ
jgi:O-antigen ligase